MDPWKLITTGLCIFTATTSFCGAQNSIVINEIHYNPDVKTEHVEFVELYNAGTNAVDLTGWAFTSGISFTFSGGPVVQPNGYVVVAAEPAAVKAKYGADALGPWVGSLDNSGETVVLANAQGQVEDEVDYQLGFPWPTVGDPPGYSIELVNPGLDNSLGGSWRISEAGGGSTPQTTTLVPVDAVWTYDESGADLGTAWRDPNYDDAGWPSGQGLLFVEGSALPAPKNTPLNLGQATYYFRTHFDYTGDVAQASLQLSTVVDDGAVVYLNGQEVDRLGMPGGTITSSTFASRTVGNAAYEGPFNIPTGALLQGDNVLAVEAHQANLNSSDIVLGAVLDVQYGGSSGHGPTPGARNAVFAANIPPQIRHVDHSPEQPKGGEAVTITAKVTDPDGVSDVTLLYQIVDPGQYIELTDPEYQTEWVSVPMRDNGTSGDAVAGDDIYTAVLPGSLQVHRRLMRYRIRAEDGGQRLVTVPYPDDPQPNFAYFVYDGVPGWQAAVHPGSTPVLTYSPEEMGRLPVYQLIAKRSTVETATWFSKYGGSDYLWLGTLVYDGKVYDHIRYRARGGVWRYAMGKNMWKFDMNRGHDFVARDNWGKKLDFPWRKLNLGASIQQGDYGHRGEQGMFESVGFRLFNLAGTAAPETAFVTLRIIDEAEEANPADQYEGDFWGLYLAVEQEDGRFLDEHNLPDGNFYKMEGGTGTLNNVGPDGPTDRSDLNSFISTYNSSPSDDWWRNNFELAPYYGYQAIIQAIHHYDVADGKNYFYYHNPVNGKWQAVPWDIDLTWADNMYRAGVNGGDEPFKSRVLTRPAFNLEYRNRLREIRDLLWNTDQAYTLIDEYARLLKGTNDGPNILAADRSQWDYNPVMINGSIVNTGKAGQGRFYQAGVGSKTFDGMVRLMKDYVTYRSSAVLDPMAADPSIPATPTATYIGPTGYPVNRLVFSASGYSGSTPFGAVDWRIAEVTDTNSPSYDPAEPLRYEIEPAWESGDLPAVGNVTIPAQAVRLGRHYRVRVRMKDSTGRASHWSSPVEFTAGEPANAADLLGALRLTEMMFNPPGGSEYEFVELRNTSAGLILDLSGVKFTDGIDFTFPSGVSLSPGGYLLLVQADPANNFADFRAHYGLGTGVPIYGPYSGSLANGGERITLKAAAGAAEIFSFAYKDGRGWPLSADGAGHSLVPLDAAVNEEGAGSLEYGGNWRASRFIGGSPGKADPQPAEDLVLNEIAAHTDFTSEFDSNDWIELFNRGTNDITMGDGWYLSDDGDQLKKWQIPAGSMVPAGGWISFDEMSGFHNPTNIGFGLNKAGEQVYLSYLPGTVQDRVVDGVRFEGQENDWSWGRYPDGREQWTALTPRTRDGANLMPPSHVVINEIMYHPPDIGGTNDNSRDEFIEVYNPTGAVVDLFNTNGTWRINGGISFLLPSEITLPAGGYVVVVNFDPTNQPALDAFKAVYQLSDPDLVLVGPYGGQLSNSGERLGLEKPQAGDLPGDPINWVLVDEVIYADRAPWPPFAADGFGASLQRADPAQAGNDATHWKASSPTPGSAAGTGMGPTITTQPQSQSVASGANVTFDVDASGSGSLSYQWLLNGSPLANETGASLQLTNVQPENSGAYSVVVFNDAGSVLSDTATLSVSLPPVILVQPLSQTVPGGADVTFGIIASGAGELTYQWRLNGTSLSGQTNSVLVLTNAQLADAGDYTVVVSDANGSVTSAIAHLDVLVPPMIIEQPHDQTVALGGTVTFNISAVGTMPMGFRWRRYNVTIANTASGALTLTNVQELQGGTYDVVITNAISGGVVSDPFQLTVLIDTDGDGMPDAWESDHGLNPNDAGDAELDSDGDGMENAQEYIAGTDPQDPESYLKIDTLSPSVGSGGAAVVSFKAMPNKSYSVLYRDVLTEGTWTKLGEIEALPNEREAQISDPAADSTARRFYRLVTPSMP